MQMAENQPVSAATGTGSGRMGSDSTLIEGLEPSSFVAAGDRLPVHLNSAFSPAHPGDPQTLEAEELEFEAWPGFTNFWVWRTNFRSGVFLKCKSSDRSSHLDWRD